MPSVFSILHFFLIGFFLMISPTKTISISPNCSNSTFTPNSTYHFNLNTLLSSLSSTASGQASRFNTTVAGGSGKRDTVYGLFMCSGVANLQQCSDCVADATRKIASACPFKKEALIWSLDCLVRYSNWPFFAAMDERPKQCVPNKEDYRGEFEKFNSALKSMMGDLITRASLKKLAVKKKSLPGDKVLFGQAECIPDLSRENCSKCLKDAADELQNTCGKGKIGGRVFYPSCMIRYEPYIFFSSDLLEGKGKISYVVLIPTVLGIVTLVVVLYCGYRLLCRKRGKINLKDQKGNFGEDISNELKSLQFDLATIEAATNKFSDENKIGEGGFGPVYKGMLSNGQEIAIIDLDERQGNTRRIAGTYGYMSQEYAMHGLFSIKSDVFSFGVMILEIISGKRNAYFDDPNSSGDLLSYAWNLWTEKRPLALLDPTLEETISETEVIRCIQVGLLCVQENPDDRPTMATIALYFSFMVDLPSPSEPPLCLLGKPKSTARMEELESIKSMSHSISSSASDVSKSKSFPR
ncbi:hypothetical protein L6164_031437 [Bauhinia variegata]|uniref:Uncharacterized protein n=1 Tax=Bauhinia variegata TaxID=167791 RepID=A0ACB9LGT3_BAUVA|nr:hypothetical protein L6164_031437 [Bauhinia variegata]